MLAHSAERVPRTQPGVEVRGQARVRAESLHKTALIGTRRKSSSGCAPTRNSAPTSTASGSTPACRTRRSSSPWSCSSRK
ncbi:hypothetical protein NKH18_03455 [Streptomyces sp. M10(2022)]